METLARLELLAVVGLLVLLGTPLVSAHVEEFAADRTFQAGPYNVLLRPTTGIPIAGQTARYDLFLLVDDGGTLRGADPSTRATYALQQDDRLIAGAFRFVNLTWIADWTLPTPGPWNATLTIEGPAQHASGSVLLDVYPAVGYRIKPFTPGLDAYQGDPTTLEFNLVWYDTVKAQRGDVPHDLVMRMEHWSDNHTQLLGEHELPMTLTSRYTYAVTYDFPESGMYHLRFKSDQFGYNDFPVQHIYAIATAATTGPNYVRAFLVAATGTVALVGILFGVRRTWKGWRSYETRRGSLAQALKPARVETERVKGLPIATVDAHAGHNHGPGEHDDHDHSHEDHDHSSHEHDHGHDDHDHDHGAELKEMAATRKMRLWVAIMLGACVMATEIAGGLAANSLVLLADAAHYATDIAAVALALVAVMWSEKAATHSKSFGYQRGEVIAAFINALALWAISVYFIWEAYQRILNPPAVHGPIVFLIGFVTLAANIALAKVLHGGSHGSINMKAAYLHVLSDVLGSAAALAAGALVYYKGWNIADPILTLFITLLILAFTWKLTRQTLHILMQGTPKHLNAHDVEASLSSIASVKEVHDLHMWTLTDGHHTLTAHVVLDATPSDDKVMHRIHDLLKTKYNLDHVTIQVESPDCPCGAPCARIE